LYLQIGRGGTRSWLLRYQMGERERFMGLGSALVFTLKQARQRAIDARRLLADDVDPIEHRKEERDAKRKKAITNITFEEAAKQYIAVHEGGWRNARHRQQWRNTLSTYANPTLGARLVLGIDTATINSCVAPIWERVPETAARVKNRIEVVIKWVREGKAMPKPSAKGEHQPALPYERMGEFMTDLRARDGISARALEFLILTASRTGATLGARWSEIDFGKQLWVIPGSRDGAKIKDRSDYHEVPLSDRAIELLKGLPRERDNVHLFIGGRKGKPLSNMALAMMVRRMNAERDKAGLALYVDPKQRNREIVVHGFRSSFRDWCGDCTAFPREVVEAAYGHAPTNKVEAAYRRGSALDKRRKLMAAWAKYCMSPVATPGANVTPIRKGEARA
jgi:integrase